MKKQKANPKAICPKCGRQKTLGSRHCYDCSQKRGTRSTRRTQLITALCRGLTLKEIALEWNRSVKTVEFHWLMAKARHGFQSYIDAVLYALDNGLVELKQVVRRQRS